MGLRKLKYKRHEFHSDPEHWHGNLLTFVYDIPYFSPCGIFPPLHILNQLLMSGGGDGGMSPGTSWEPFTIDQIEYDALTKALDATPLSEIEPHARYAHLKPKFDSSFDEIADYTDWMIAVCEKHRDARGSELDAVHNPS